VALFLFLKIHYSHNKKSPRIKTTVGIDYDVNEIKKKKKKQIH